MKGIILYYTLLGITSALFVVGLSTLMGIAAGKIPLNNDVFLFLIIIFVFFELMAWAQSEYRKALEEDEEGEEVE